MSTLTLGILRRLKTSTFSYIRVAHIDIAELSKALVTGKTTTTVQPIKFFHAGPSVIPNSTFNDLIGKKKEVLNQQIYQFNGGKLLCITPSKFFHTSRIVCENDDPEAENNAGQDENAERKTSRFVKRIDYETSKRYLESEAYTTTYGDEPVWVKYRRNFKGQFAPKKTRESCIKLGVMSTGNPCPICRDDYLVIDYRNVKLLKQFVSPYTDRTLFYNKTCLCQKKQREMEVAIEKAKMYGFLTFYVPFREYNYNDYYDFKNKKESQ